MDFLRNCASPLFEQATEEQKAILGQTGQSGCDPWLHRLQAREIQSPAVHPICAKATNVLAVRIPGDVPPVVGIGGGSPAVHQTGWTVEKETTTRRTK
jgi:hypothetical protein